MLAPNSPLRPAVTALAPHAVAPTPESKPAVETAADDPPEAIRRSPARDLWARRLTRFYQAFPLTCPPCGAEMRIIAFITESVVVRAILEHLGEPATPPRIAQARGPPEWDEDAGSASPWEDDSAMPGDPLAPPEPAYEFDQGNLVAACRRLLAGLWPVARNPRPLDGKTTRQNLPVGPLRHTSAPHHGPMWLDLTLDRPLTGPRRG